MRAVVEGSQYQDLTAAEWLAILAARYRDPDYPYRAHPTYAKRVDEDTDRLRCLSCGEILDVSPRPGWPELMKVWDAWKEDHLSSWTGWRV